MLNFLKNMVIHQAVGQTAVLRRLTTVSEQLSNLPYLKEPNESANMCPGELKLDLETAESPEQVFRKFYRPKKYQPKQDLPTPNLPAQDHPIGDLPKQELPIEDCPKQVLPTEEPPKQDLSTQVLPPQDLPKQDLCSQDVPIQVLSTQDLLKQDVSTEDTPIEPISTQYLPKQDLPTQDLTQDVWLHERPQNPLKDSFQININCLTSVMTMGDNAGSEISSKVIVEKQEEKLRDMNIYNARSAFLLRLGLK